jgi:hypothetical protein
MRRGCISLGNIKCDKCHRQILYPERYLYIEVTHGKPQSLCMDCCKEDGMVRTGSEKENSEILFDLGTD